MYVVIELQFSLLAEIPGFADWQASWRLSKRHWPDVSIQVLLDWLMLNEAGVILYSNT